VVLIKHTFDGIIEHSGYFVYLQGLLYAYSIRQLVTTTMNLHVSLQKPMTKASVLVTCRLVELLKAIEHTFHRRTMLLAECLNHIIQNVSHRVLTTLKTVKVSGFTGGSRAIFDRKISLYNHKKSS